MLPVSKDWKDMAGALADRMGWTDREAGVWLGAYVEFVVRQCRTYGTAVLPGVCRLVLRTWGGKAQDATAGEDGSEMGPDGSDAGNERSGALAGIVAGAGGMRLRVVFDPQFKKAVMEADRKVVDGGGVDAGTNEDRAMRRMAEWLAFRVLGVGLPEAEVRAFVDEWVEVRVEKPRRERLRKLWREWEKECFARNSDPHYDVVLLDKGKSKGVDDGMV